MNKLSNKTVAMPSTFDVDLRKIRTIHFVGVKGVGMAALAVMAKEMGKRVSGSDIDEEFQTDRILAKYQIPVTSRFKLEVFDTMRPLPDLVVYTGAHGGITNPECVAAKKHHIRVMNHAQALALFSSGKKTIAVAGTHGKTTIASMIAHMLMHNRKDPSFAVGTPEIMSLGTSGHYGKGDYFVAEADEYVADPTGDKSPRFLYLSPHIAIINTIDYDHPDVFQSLEEIQDAFIMFANRVSSTGYVLLNADDEHVRAISNRIASKKITYGFAKEADCRIMHSSIINGTNKVLLSYRSKKYAYDLPIYGKHNVQNAAAVILCGFLTGLDWNRIRDSLQTFIGTKRRFEPIGLHNNILFFDDYAHHPREIIATLEAARTRFPARRIIVIFQPHTYSRTIALRDEFSSCFSGADIVFIAPIFASAREKQDNRIDHERLAKDIAKYHKNVYAVSSPTEFVTKYLRLLRPNDILITMGAGDIYTWQGEIDELNNTKRN